MRKIGPTFSLGRKRLRSLNGFFFFAFMLLNCWSLNLLGFKAVMPLFIYFCSSYGFHTGSMYVKPADTLLIMDRNLVFVLLSGRG